jgi:hypothetical protein
VRRGEHHHLCAWRDEGPQLIDRQPKLGPTQRRHLRHRLAHGDRGRIPVVEGLEQQDFVARVQQADHRRCQRLGRTRRADHLRQRIEFDAVATLLMTRDRVYQRQHPHRAAVLVVPSTKRGHGVVDDQRRAVEVGKALRQVHGTMLHRQRGHLAEDAGAKRCEGGLCHLSPQPAFASPSTAGARRRRGRVDMSTTTTEALPLPWRLSS